MVPGARIDCLAVQHRGFKLPCLHGLEGGNGEALAFQDIKYFKASFLIESVGRNVGLSPQNLRKFLFFNYLYRDQADCLFAIHLSMRSIRLSELPNYNRTRLGHCVYARVD